MQLIDALFDLSSQVKRPILAIDGPAGAGKTTLAEHLTAALSLKYKCHTLHMDDLYNGWQDAFDHHLTDALVAAVTAHQKSEKFSLSRFDWQRHEYGPAVEVPASEILILEGVGSSQSAIRSFLTASIWIEIEPERGLERVLLRDGTEISQEMNMWLALQEQHFRSEGSEKAADFALSN